MSADISGRMATSAGVPVQVPTIDGSVSAFEVVNILHPFHAANGHSEMVQGLFAIQMLIN